MNERQPDFDAMWTKIESKVQSERMKGSAPAPARRRVRAAAIGLVAAGSLLAMPAFARMPLAWDELWQRFGVETAVKGGFGEAIDRTVTSGGVPFTLRGVVADESQTALLFELGVKPGDRVAAFGEATLIGEDGSETPLHTYFSFDDTEKLSGKLTADRGLGKPSERLRVSAKDVTFYRLAERPVGALSEGKTIALQSGPFREAKITKYAYDAEAELLTIRYEIEATEADALDLAPRFELVMEGKRVPGLNAAVLPSERPNLLVAETSYHTAEAVPAGAEWRFNYLAADERIEGDWTIAFDAAAVQAEAVYRKKLDVAADNDSDMTLRSLTVTPLNIRIALKDFPSNSVFATGEPEVRYRDIALSVDGRIVEGGLWHTDEEGYHLRFETPDWRSDWSNVPMELVMRDASLYRLADAEHLLTLASPSAEPQTIETELNGYPVTYTYYVEGDRLMLESDSPDDRFGGVNQSYIVDGRKKVWSKFEAGPPVRVDNRRKEWFERKDLPDGELLLNPGTYLTLEPERVERVWLNGEEQDDRE